MKHSNNLVQFLHAWHAFTVPPATDRVGFGHRVREGDDLREWAKAVAIMRDKADAMLRDDLAIIADQFSPAIRISITQNKFDALCAFIYDTDDIQAAIELVNLINNAAFDRAALMFTHWAMPSPQSLRRRFAEQCIFTRADYTVRP